MVQRFQEIKEIAVKDQLFVKQELYAVPVKGKSGYVLIQHWVDMILCHLPNKTQDEVLAALKLDGDGGNVKRKIDYEDYLELTSRLLMSDLCTVTTKPEEDQVQGQGGEGDAEQTEASVVLEEEEVKGVEAEESLSSLQQPIAVEGSLLFKWIQWLQQE